MEGRIYSSFKIFSASLFLLPPPVDFPFKKRYDRENPRLPDKHLPPAGQNPAGGYIQCGAGPVSSASAGTVGRTYWEAGGDGSVNPLDSSYDGNKPAVRLHLTY